MQILYQSGDRLMYKVPMVTVSSYVSVGEIENTVITIYLIVDTFRMWEQNLGSFFGQENSSPYHVRHEEFIHLVCRQRALFFWFGIHGQVRYAQPEAVASDFCKVLFPMHPCSVMMLACNSGGMLPSSKGTT